MSRSVNIFIDTDLSLGKIVSHIEMLIGVKLDQYDDDGDLYFEYKDSPMYLTFGAHDFLNDRDMNFEDYVFMLDVRAIGIHNAEERISQQKIMGQEIYNKLKGTSNFKLMLVDDVQKKIEEFNPTEE